jgi:hypothetical protein
MKRFMSKKLLVVGVAVALVLGIGGAAFAYFTTTGTGTGNAYTGAGSTVSITQLPPKSAVLYDSVVSPLPGSLPSYGFESDSVTEFGNEINLASPGQELSSVVVTMESWTCGNWAAAGSPPCTSTPGSSYSVPITLYIYNVGAGNTVGSFIASDTQSFNIPFRPSANASCPSGEWYDNTATALAYGVTADNKCHSGLATNITFDGSAFSTPNITLPGSVIYGIAFNTTDYGLAPTHVPGPYDSLNVALSQDPTNVTVGSDSIVGGDWLNSSNASSYCDGGVGGTGAFRLDAAAGGCSSSPSSNDAINSPAPSATTYYIPAVQFNGLASGYIYLMPGGPAQAIDFSITNAGGSPAYVQGVTFAITSVSGTTDNAACLASGWFTLVQPSIPVGVNIPANTTVDYQPSGGAIALIESGTNQDICENATLGLTFTSS